MTLLDLLMLIAGTVIGYYVTGLFIDYMDGINLKSMSILAAVLAVLIFLAIGL